LDDVTTYLFVLDADSEAATAESARRLDEAYGAGRAEVSGGLQPRWGPTDRIAFHRTDTERPDDSLETDLCTIAPDGDGLRTLTNGNLRTGAARWHPGGEKIAFVAGNPENWYEPSEVYVVDERTREYWSVSGSLDRTVARTGRPEWRDDETIVCPFADEGLTRLVALDAEADAPQRIFDAQGRDRNVEAFDLAGNTVAVGLGTASEGTDVHSFDASSLDPSRESVRRLTELNADVLAQAPAPQVRRVSFENSDGDEVEAIAYLPADFDFGDPDPVATIAAIHGGPMSYDAPTFTFEHTVWTSRGYGIVRVNYRGSTSYGREFSERLKGSRGDLESDDVVSGVRHLVDEGWADPDRLFVTGFSYGGITSAHIVTRYDDFAAAAPEHGIYDFYSNFGTDDNHIWHEWEFGLPWENQEKYRDLSSLTDVDQIETPLLITAGEEDWRCPPTQAEQLYVSVRKRGIDAKLVVYPGENHNIGDPKRVTHRLRELTDWFETHDPGT
jgi:dipeptidyl aminopeptidase/acylaminoacyl peptidase